MYEASPRNKMRFWGSIECFKDAANNPAGGPEQVASELPVGDEYEDQMGNVNENPELVALIHH